MSELTSTDDRQVGPAERLHPLFLLTGLGGSLRGLAGGYAFIGYLLVAGRFRTALLVAAVLLTVMIAGLILYWTRFEFRVGPSEIRIDSGVLHRTHRSIPFDRVQDVDISQGPIGRLLDIARVKFETGAAGAGQRDEGVLQAIPLSRAEDLRNLVRQRRGSGTAIGTGETPDTAESTPVFSMTFPRLALSGLFNFSLALFAGLFGLSQTAGDVLGFDPLSRRFWRETLDPANPLAAYVLDHRIAAVMAGIFILLVAGLLTGLVRTLLRDYGFRLDHTGIGLRRRRGLLTRTDVTLPARRAQAAIVATGPVREYFGWHELRLQSLAADDSGKSDHTLAPLARRSEIDRILGSLGWPGLAADPGWRGVSSAHVTTLAIGMSPLLLLALVQAAVAPAVFLIPVAVYVFAVATRWVAWQRTAWALDGDRLLIRTGWWRRRIIILPVRRIQSIDYNESAVSRRFGIASLSFGVAGGSGYSAHRIPALPRNDARGLRDRLLSLLS